MTTSSTTGKVLLIDDHAASVLVMTTFLDECGFTYDIAQSGKEGWLFAQSGDYRAILMNVTLEDINGFELTARIRALEEKIGRAPVPIIAITAHGLLGDKDKCIEAGMTDYLAKPFNCQELENKLKKIK